MAKYYGHRNEQDRALTFKWDHICLGGGGGGETENEKK